MDNLDNLVEKAKGVTENIPEDMKQKAGDVIDGLQEKLPEGIGSKVDGVLDDLQDKLGLN
ncbi:MAG: hypothetical protein ACK5LM_06240 [Lactovum sp.]